MMETYKEAESYILGIPRFAGKHTLADTERLLGKITGGSIKSKIIHVAGTNGKGSVCAYLCSLLTESGRRVGVFTSPHLECMRERIAIGREIITEERFLQIYGKVRQAAMEEERKGQGHPSFFEFLFLMAMGYFAEEQPDYLILETGMGGRLDATNCIKKPSLCVVTEIGLDHMQYLGSSIREIAGEKAGIIKPGVPVVFVDKRKESTEVLAEYAKKTESPAIIIKKDDIFNVNINHKTIDFSLHTGYYSYVSLLLDTTAIYQTENAALAVAAAGGLRGEKITPDTIRKGLWECHWPGRMEEILPGIYLDGAHNEDGIEALLNTVRKDGCWGRRFLLFGVAGDKSYGAMIKRIAHSGLFGHVAVAVLETERSASMDRLKTVWGQYKEIPCLFYDNAEEAYLHLLGERRGGDFIYIAGSLYLAGEMKTLIRRMQND